MVNITITIYLELGSSTNPLRHHLTVIIRILNCKLIFFFLQLEDLNVKYNVNVVT